MTSPCLTLPDTQWNTKGSDTLDTGHYALVLTEVNWLLFFFENCDSVLS